MHEQLIVLSGSTFFVSNPTGDVDPGGEPNGFFVRDMRHLSKWRLLVDGRATRLLSSGNLGHDSARFFSTLGWARMGHDPTISVRRQRRVGQGLREEIVVENHTAEERRVLVELEYGSDFADVFEVKDPRPKQGEIRFEPTPRGAILRYQRDGFWRATDVTFEPVPADPAPGRAAFDVVLGPRERWHLHIDVTCTGDGVFLSAAGLATPVPGHHAEEPEPAGSDDGSPAPALEADSSTLLGTYRQSLVDVAALRFRPFADQPWTPPAAGLPWFMALFGRDSLITSYQALPFDPSLAATTLESLAGLQASAVDDFRDAEPGKILHELRYGEMVHFKEAPQGPYYGTHDATPLFLVLLDEYERWTGDLGLVRRLEAAARAALDWMDSFGDLDGDGYLEYQTRSPRGLVNQYWKDSWNSVLFAGGRLAEGPIATCDVQGYAYDAYRRTARLARVAWGDDDLARRLDAGAADLRRRFNEDFWSAARGHYVLALDGRKRQVDSLTSNVGHLLWSGIVDPERAAGTVARLMAPDMFSGWGVRTMSTRDGGYSPIGYHNGTVWPHDTAIVAEGFRRYGFREEASRLAAVLFEAAGWFEHRLPEAFTGFSREESPFPVEYPTASRPQGWAAGAPLLALRTLLGLDVVDGALRPAPHVPAALGRVRLKDLPVLGTRVEAP